MYGRAVCFDEGDAQRFGSRMTQMAGDSLSVLASSRDNPDLKLGAKSVKPKGAGGKSRYNARLPLTPWRRRGEGYRLCRRDA
jgi:hypothetical protein